MQSWLCISEEARFTSYITSIHAGKMKNSNPVTPKRLTSCYWSFLPPGVAWWDDLVLFYGMVQVLGGRHGRETREV